MSIDLLWECLIATGETLYMTLAAAVIAVVIGLPLGVLLYLTRASGLTPHAFLARILSIVVNSLRSIPFIILLVALIPFTRIIIGTSIGTSAAIVPLCISAIPFVARMVENALLEISSGLIEAGIAMGATTMAIVRRILLPEALPSIINGMTVMLITLVGYSAMAGAVGGGGLGDLAIRYGYQRFNTTIMIVTIVILIVIVQCLQVIGERLARHYTRDL